MICKLCTWAADTYGDAQWIESGGELGYPLNFAWPGEMKAAAVEAHAECASAGHGRCDCQHWLPGQRTHIGPALVNHFPARCSVCYRRHTVTPKGGVIHWHKTDTPSAKNGYRRFGRCPGSGKPPLAKGTAVVVDSSSPASPETE